MVRGALVLTIPVGTALPQTGGAAWFCPGGGVPSVMVMSRTTHDLAVRLTFALA